MRTVCKLTSIVPVLLPVPALRLRPKDEQCVAVLRPEPPATVRIGWVSLASPPGLGRVESPRKQNRSAKASPMMATERWCCCWSVIVRLLLLELANEGTHCLACDACYAACFLGEFPYDDQLARRKENGTTCVGRRIFPLSAAFHQCSLRPVIYLRHTTRLANYKLVGQYIAALFSVVLPAS